MRHGINVPLSYTAYHKSGQAVVAGLSNRQPRAVSAGRWLHLRASSSRPINGAGPSFKPATTDEEWLELYKQVNGTDFPQRRTFKAVGAISQGAEEFTSAMVDVVEKATCQQIDRETQVTERFSSGGKYLAVSIRKVTVSSGREVLKVYREMRKDKRVRYII